MRSVAATDLSAPEDTALIDIGLLILRIGVGAAMIHAGLLKVFDRRKVVRRTVWSARIAIGLLVVAIGAAILTWILLNGTNPIHFSAPTS
jgi:putative oxidoreductase